MVIVFTHDDQLLIAGVFPHYETSVQDFMIVFTHNKATAVSKREVIEQMHIVSRKIKDATFPEFHLLDPDTIPDRMLDRRLRELQIRKHKRHFVHSLWVGLREQVGGLEDEMLEFRRSAATIDSAAFLIDTRPICQFCRRFTTGASAEKMPGAFFCEVCFCLETFNLEIKRLKATQDELKRRLRTLVRERLELREFDDEVS
ncbi:MAG: hypothetical protein Q9174_001251 [Haloplaca sp. 1 TL-2023]